MHQLFEHRFGERQVNRDFPVAVREMSVRSGAGDDGEGRNRRKEKGFEVIAADDDDQVRLGIRNVFSDLAYRGDIGIELLRNL